MNTTDLFIPAKTDRDRDTRGHKYKLSQTVVAWMLENITSRNVS